MNRIDLKLFVTLAQYHPGEGRLEIENGTTVADLIKNCGIPEEEVKLIFINGRKAGAGDVIRDGDRVGLFPPVGGG
ncbi:MAG: MoaD/ThiS family protein [Desulfobacter sp.]|nr:MAG: MoaD/ThiS family protein [Desulfobacter sp.]